jgi:unsaturated rhamnogalacturonyl hydrolase
MRLRFVGLCLVIANLWIASAAWAEPTKGQIVDLMRRVGDWQWEHLATESAAANDSNTNWIRATFFMGDMALYRVTQDQRYLDQLLHIAEGNHWQPGIRKTKDGKTTILRHADDLAVGQAYLELYLLRHDERMIAPLQKRVDSIMSEPMAGHLDWWWCDALFMAPPMLARLSNATGEAKYLDYMDKQFWDTADFLYDKHEHLMFRDKNYFAMKEPNGQKVFWSRGDGWVLAGIARVLQFMPADSPDRSKYIDLFRDLSNRVAGLQQSDGFWRMSLLDPDSVPNGESSGTALYCFAFAWGVNNGILPRDRFMPVIDKAWSALAGATETNGRLDWVQPVGQKPGAALKQNSTAAYGPGALLLAGEQMIKLSGDSR